MLTTNNVLNIGAIATIVEQAFQDAKTPAAAADETGALAIVTGAADSLEVTHDGTLTSLITAIKALVTATVQAAFDEINPLATELGVTVPASSDTLSTQADALAVTLKAAANAIGSDANATTVASTLVAEAVDSIDEWVATVKAAESDANAALKSADNAQGQVELASIRRRTFPPPRRKPLPSGPWAKPLRPCWRQKRRSTPPARSRQLCQHRTPT